MGVIGGKKKRWKDQSKGGKQHGEMCEMRTRENHQGRKVKGSKMMSHLVSGIWTIIYPRQWQMVPMKQLGMDKQHIGRKQELPKFEPTAIFCHEAPNMCTQQQHSPLCAPPSATCAKAAELIAELDKEQRCCQEWSPQFRWGIKQTCELSILKGNSQLRWFLKEKQG